MPHVMNSLPTPVSVQAQSKWFSFKPNEIKMFYQPEIARFLGQLKGEEGLVEIPDSIMELEKTDPVRINFIEEKRKEGINARVKKLEWIKHNLLSSLRFDIEAKGMKMDPLILASKADRDHLRELKALAGDQMKQQEDIAGDIRKELGMEDYVVETKPELKPKK